MKEFACYKGDKFLCIGTLKEIADYLEIGYKTLTTYKSKGIIYIFVELRKDDYNGDWFIRNYNIY